MRAGGKLGCVESIVLGARGCREIRHATNAFTAHGNDLDGVEGL
jgi:hypothetical protein